ncbi:MULTISPECIES: N-acetylmuramoyl-L-alanine amidase [Bacillus]|uniref:N-acetylmuramoyl-L-alanine amidase n=1 Tax=Bacillus TaxID=1386 RepID=UPI001C63A02E|nr:MULTISPECIES: N-acetylmuramoyl-L-alanine amidase [Bacillus]QWU43809.1 N-acetylmuramoyl-L-alanine amidase [Bacillus sp. NP247]UYX53413.1 N-acetylmuramoyl-L-alanine amidase [Bacillus thuringiensis]
MKYKAIAAGILAANLLAFPISSLAETKKFPDVPDNAYSKDAIYYLVEKNVISGMPDGNFAPQGKLTRAEAATIIAKAIGLAVNPSAKPSFNDSKDHWAAQYIAAIEKADIISGRTPSVFDPEGKITRAEMASMLVKAYKLKDQVKGPITNKFADLENHFGKEAANILVALEISAGTGKTTWSPDMLIPREQAAQMTYKADKLKNNNDGNKQPEETKKMYIDRKFITYHGPSLSSGITDNQHNPQTVEVKEERDGWIKIVTSKGDKWTPLTEKTDVINEGFTAYEKASHGSKVLGTYGAQTVTVIEEKDSWIRIRTNSGFQWVDKNQLNPVKQGNFLEGKAIIIDPGHGGIDSGNPGYYEKESQTVLDVSLRLQKIFEKKTPFTVLLTRENDTRPGNTAAESLQKRVEFAQANKGDIFVSIHGNGTDSKQGQGTETFYYESATARGTNPNVSESRLLAEKIQDRLVDALGTKDRGVKKGDLYVIRENTMPAVLAELAFVDNKSDADKLATPAQRQSAAEAIYQGILDYYEETGNNVSSYR